MYRSHSANKRAPTNRKTSRCFPLYVLLQTGHISPTSITQPVTFRLRARAVKRAICCSKYPPRWRPVDQPCSLYFGQRRLSYQGDLPLTRPHDRQEKLEAISPFHVKDTPRRLLLWSVLALGTSISFSTCGQTYVEILSREKIAPQSEIVLIIGS